MRTLVRINIKKYNEMKNVDVIFSTTTISIVITKYTHNHFLLFLRILILCYVLLNYSIQIILLQLDGWWKNAIPFKQTESSCGLS